MAAVPVPGRGRRFSMSNRLRIQASLANPHTSQLPCPTCSVCALPCRAIDGLSTGAGTVGRQGAGAEYAMPGVHVNQDTLNVIQVWMVCGDRAPHVPLVLGPPEKLPVCLPQPSLTALLACHAAPRLLFNAAPRLQPQPAEPHGAAAAEHAGPGEAEPGEEGWVLLCVGRRTRGGEPASGGEEGERHLLPVCVC